MLYMTTPLQFTSMLRKNIFVTVWFAVVFGINWLPVGTLTGNEVMGCLSAVANSVLVTCIHVIK